MGPEEMLNGPIMEVFAISNGFLLKINSIHHGELATLTFAKDEIGIAEEIIAAQARHKLEIERQHEMDFNKKSEPHVTGASPQPTQTQ